MFTEYEIFTMQIFTEYEIFNVECRVLRAKGDSWGTLVAPMGLGNPDCTPLKDWGTLVARPLGPS